ncbi:hypothetical protein D6855_07215 [Butyrivibrio sp. CB08]|uniref:hypothetical protein n=1 Tax=Butyrivibrio sp. CB08 TaxID=2364879 RepID=UPI000EA8955A|nr:hypothetical protein [Butyrivibrio sp. CB08]RKM60498.1 hypothetical protein D6855_07215 [Butyrivibrio sp. CB08]
MNRTKQFYDLTMKYRKGLNEINDKYDAELAKIDKYRGSAGYDKDRDSIEHRRKDAIAAFQNERLTAFLTIIDEMRKTAKSRTMTAPTSEELALLQALKMRDNIGKDELEQASRTLRNCPVGLSILDEIAKKNDVMGVRFGAESTDSILNHINSLEESAKRLCALDRCDSRQEMLLRRNIHGADYDPQALYSFAVDRDFISENDALTFMGGVTDLDSFRDAVNTEEVWHYDNA